MAKKQACTIVRVVVGLCPEGNFIVGGSSGPKEDGIVKNEISDGTQTAWHVVEFELPSPASGKMPFHNLGKITT